MWCPGKQWRWMETLWNKPVNMNVFFFLKMVGNVLKLMFKSRIMILYRKNLETILWGQKAKVLNISWVINLGTAACLPDLSSAAFWFTLESCKSWSSPFLLRGFHITITLYTPTAKEGLYGVCNDPYRYRFCRQLQQLQHFLLLCAVTLFSALATHQQMVEHPRRSGTPTIVHSCVCLASSLSLYYT